MPHRAPYRRNVFIRRLSGIGQRLHRAYFLISDGLYRATIGTSIFRRSSESGSRAKWKILSLWNERWGRFTSSLHRTTAPGRVAQQRASASLGRIFGAIGYGFFRASQPAQRMVMFFGVTWEEIKHKVVTNSRLRALSWPIRLLYRIIAPPTDFVVAWLWTRKYRSLLLGVPAFVLFLPLAICLVRLPLYGADAKARHYQRAAFEAIRNREHSKADLLFRKLNQLGIDRPAVIYSEASVMAEQGDVVEAFRKMQSIAPVDEGGFAAAHFWIAQAIYSRIVTVPEEERINLAERHLRHVLSQFPSEPLATQLMADVLHEAGRYDEGEDLLKDLTGRRFSPSQQIRLARSYWKWGQPDAARELAILASDGFRLAQDSGELLQSDDYLHWLAAEELLGRPDHGLEVLRMALISNTYDDVLTQAEKIAIRFLSVSWATGNCELWLDAAQRALQIEPILEGVQLSVLTTASRNPRVAPRVRELMVPFIETGRASPQVEKLTADLSMVSGNYTQAREDYERILEHDETNLKVANNLAWIYGNVDPVDLAKALRLSNRAVGFAPNNASLRETRAQILVKLKRWREAANDLEFAVNGLPDYYPVHEALAECYDHLNQVELADAHRERSRLLRLKEVRHER